MSIHHKVFQILKHSDFMSDRCPALMLPSQTILFLLVCGLICFHEKSSASRLFATCPSQELSEAFNEYALSAKKSFDKLDGKFFMFRSQLDSNSNSISLPEVEGCCFVKGGQGMSVSAPLGAVDFGKLSTISSIDKLAQLTIKDNSDNVVLAILNKEYHASILSKQQRFSKLETCSSDMSSYKMLFTACPVLHSFSAPIFGFELWSLVNKENVSVVHPQYKLAKESSRFEGFGILGLMPDIEESVDLWFCRDTKRLAFVTGKEKPNKRWYIEFIYGDSSSVVPIQSKMGYDGVEGVYIVEINQIAPPFTVANDKFYLSGYGIPEPDWYKPPKPWWFYTSIVGMVLVVVGAVVLHFGKRLWREGSAKQNNKRRR
jgi:hypothetical protein